MTKRAAAAVLSAVLAAALSSCSNAQVRDSLYEGLKSRERVAEPVPELNPPERLPPYPEYEAERKKLMAPEGGDAR